MELLKIKEIIAALLSVDETRITEKTGLTKDLGMDSLDIFQLVSEIEDAFNVEFPADAPERIKTVGDAVEFLKDAY